MYNNKYAISTKFNNLTETQKEEQINRLQKKYGKNYIVNSELYFKFCPHCNEHESNTIFIKEDGYYERTVTLKCNKCNNYYKYKG